jgi:hypothetical protein
MMEASLGPILASLQSYSSCRVLHTQSGIQIHLRATDSQPWKKGLDPFIKLHTIVVVVVKVDEEDVVKLLTVTHVQTTVIIIMILEVDAPHNKYTISRRG